jgi:hypothetical protein
MFDTFVFVYFFLFFRRETIEGVPNEVIGSVVFVSFVTPLEMKKRKGKVRW